MNDLQTPSSFAECEAELNALLSAADTLCTNTGRLETLHNAADRYVEDIRGLLENRGIRAPTIGFVGDKNAGKSFLLRLLITDPQVRNEIPCGMGDEGRTERLIWVGTDLPGSLRGDDERALRMDMTKHSLLGKDSVLVDIPGYNDGSSQSARRIARELALRSCQVKVLVFDACSAPAEAVANYARELIGPVILPVLNLVDVGGNLDSPEVEAQRLNYERGVRDGVESRRASMGGAPVLVCPAIVIPDLKDDPPVESDEQAAGRLATALHDAVRSLEGHPELAHASVLTRRERFLGEARHLFAADHVHVQELLEKLDRDAAALPSKLVPVLVGGERASSAGIRIWLRTEVVRRTSSGFFPLRAFLAVLALTTRAWDGLVLSMAGSVPSLFKVAFNLFGNLRVVRNRPLDSTDSLDRLLRQIAFDAQQADMEALRRCLDRMGASSHVSREVPLPKPKLQGLGDLRDEAMRIFDETITISALPVWVIQVAGWVSVAWCTLLIFGPLQVVYKHHLVKLWESVFQGTAMTWQDFPVPPHSVVLGWVILAFIPVFVLALILQAVAASATRVHRTRQELEENVAILVEELSRKGVLAVELRGVKIDAARGLFGRLFPRTQRTGLDAP